MSPFLYGAEKIAEALTPSQNTSNTPKTMRPHVVPMPETGIDVSDSSFPQITPGPDKGEAAPMSTHDSSDLSIVQAQGSNPSKRTEYGNSNNKKVNPSNEELRNITTMAGAELIFIAFPFIVLLIVNLFNDGTAQWLGIFRIHDWSLTAAILSGQAITRFVFMILAGGFNVRPGMTVLFITFLLIPLFSLSLIVLILILVSTNGPPHVALIVGQVALFVVATCFYLMPEGTRYYLKRKDNRSIDSEKVK